MKINSNIGVQNVVKAYQKVAPKAEQKTHVGFETDKIEISKEAKIQQAAMKALHQLPEIREEKVAQIKEQIKTGNYNPTAEQVIDKMLEIIK